MAETFCDERTMAHGEMMACDLVLGHPRKHWDFLHDYQWSAA